MTSSIVLTDPHEALREGLARLLSAAGWRVLGEAATLPEGLALAAALHPHLVLVDETAASVPEVADMTRALALLSPRSALVLYAADASAAAGRLAATGPAHAVASKRAGLAELLATLAAAASLPGAAVSGPPPDSGPIPRAAYAPAAAFVASTVPQPGAAAISALSKREREVMALLAEGLTGEQIAAQLFLSGQTVKTHVRNALVKLRAANRTHAIAIAIRDGHIPGPRGHSGSSPAKPVAA